MEKSKRAQNKIRQIIETQLNAAIDSGNYDEIIKLQALLARLS